MWPFNRINNDEESINPYVIGNCVGNSSAFVGREDVLKDVCHILQHSQQNAIVLYGQRRIGKTSILKELETQLAKENYLPIFFDLQDKGTLPLEQVNQELANKISDKLNNQSQPTLENILFQWKSSKKLVILFDEFEAFAGNEFEERQASETFFPYWRKILSKVDKAKLNFVFTLGRKVEDLNINAMSLLKGILSKKVSLLGHDATVRLIQLSDSKTNQTLKWDHKAIKTVLTQTGGHPFITQILCYCIWYDFYDSNPLRKPKVKKIHVDQILAKALEIGENGFHWLWDGLPATEKLVTSILASTDNQPITAQTLEQLLKNHGLNINQQEQQMATDILKNWDVIKQVAEDNFSFRVELFRRWIVENKPLTKVQQELDSHENLVAHNFYERGNKSRALGELAKAIDDFETAIKLNPRHISANHSLIQIYLDLKKWEKAWETAKAFSLLRPQLARPLISQALEGLNAGQDEDLQLYYYHEILKIDPEHADVKQKLKKLVQEIDKNKRIAEALLRKLVQETTTLDGIFIYECQGQKLYLGTTKNDVDATILKSIIKNSLFRDKTSILDLREIAERIKDEQNSNFEGAFFQFDTSILSIYILKNTKVYENSEEDVFIIAGIISTNNNIRIGKFIEASRNTVNRLKEKLPINLI